MKKQVLCLLCTLLCLFVTACGVNRDANATEQVPMVIGIIDTGFSSRAIPQESILEGKNYLDDTLSTEDTYGHGTAVASVILERCPDAKLVPLVSNAYDGGKITQVDNDVFARMIRDAVDIYGCRIINISAGLVLDKDSVREAVQYAEEQNVLVVASAGNDYASSGSFQYYPAGYESVLAVGALTPDESAISDFSQRGEWVDLYAVGEDITIRTLSGNTRTSDGTSYSAARVSAYAARLLQIAPQLTVEDLRQQILDSADTLPDGTKYIG